MDPFAVQAEFKFVKELPKTKRNLEEQARIEAQERQHEEFKKQEKKMSEEQQQRLKAEEWERAKHKQEIEKKRLEEDRRKREEVQQRSTLEGRLAKLIADLNSNNTNSEVTLSGIDMGPARWRILAEALETNISLKELHLVKKGISDDDGEELMTRLKKNFTLEKLELQGNNLGKSTGRVVGELLEINDTMKYIDLEGNDLYDKDLKDISGIVSIAEGIKKNTCLVTLNLSSCNLDNQCGKLLADALKVNEVIIHFDFRRNDFDLDTVREINHYLQRNKELYDKERMMEWNERKSAHKEDEYMEMLEITLQQEHMKKVNIMGREEATKQEKVMRWEEERLKKDIEMKREMDKLMNEAKKRQESGKKKGKRHGGKKK
ncbi:hypothetical protein SteCoe_27603 [Stentor coeruleus]|uniref:Uncharacterized protein n=1 Tax=Stentor coeruleus TaxID=5963 RepID=A0A1R2BA92_9CILI|nr:hypothetical protein SteCoe_27603 [Stentor coeruleus]